MSLHECSDTQKYHFTALLQDNNQEVHEHQTEAGNLTRACCWHTPASSLKYHQIYLQSSYNSDLRKHFVHHAKHLHANQFLYIDGMRCGHKKLRPVHIRTYHHLTQTWSFHPQAASTSQSHGPLWVTTSAVLNTIFIRRISNMLIRVPKVNIPHF